MRCLVSVLALAACSTASGAPPTPAAAASPVPTATAARLPPIGDATATGRIVGARIVAAIGTERASDRPVHARADQTVTLFAVLEVAAAGRTDLYSDAPTLRLGGRDVTPRPLAQAPRVELRWNKIEPTTANLSNGDGDTFHYEAIGYAATPIEAATGRASLIADVHPTLTPDYGPGLGPGHGTMRYQLVAQQGERVIASPGPEARRGKASGGLTDAVLRVSLRRDDSYLGFLTEMYNQPYIWASAGTSDATHQSERLEGSDCADFIVYGARRMGAPIAYTYTGGLPKVTRLLAAGARDASGVYRDAAGQPIPFPRPGDLLLFPRHVGAVAVDRGTVGVLDDQDLMMHTLFDAPKEQAIADSGYAVYPVEVRRFTPRAFPRVDEATRSAASR